MLLLLGEEREDLAGVRCRLGGDPLLPGEAGERRRLGGDLPGEGRRLRAGGGFSISRMIAFSLLILLRS